jgi:hypothetical protein
LDEIAGRKRDQDERSDRSLKKIKLQSPERKREAFRKNTETYREANRDKTREANQRSDEKNRAAKQFYDPQCDRVFGNKHQLEAHLKATVHLKKVAELQLSSSGSSS